MTLELRELIHDCNWLHFEAKKNVKRLKSMKKRPFFKCCEFFLSKVMAILNSEGMAEISVFLKQKCVQLTHFQFEVNCSKVLVHSGVYYRFY